MLYKAAVPSTIGLNIWPYLAKKELLPALSPMELLQFCSLCRYTTPASSRWKVIGVL